MFEGDCLSALAVETHWLAVHTAGTQMEVLMCEGFDRLLCALGKK